MPGTDGTIRSTGTSLAGSNFLCGRFRLLLLFLLAGYGAIAGLQTVADFDLGWQMADARHPFSSVDTLSYTAPGAPWLYPPLAGIVFRLLFTIGGYAAISWFCMAALLATLAILACKSNRLTLLLLLLAVPVLAQQIIPRSGLFTIVLGAAYSRILFDHFLGRGSRRLWLLPPLMVLWVNLHTGFIAGLGLMLGYVAAELADAVRPLQRQVTLARLKQAAPWFAAAFLATLLNPWGFRIYAAIAAQEHLSSLQSAVILELAPLYGQFYWSSLHPFTSLGIIWWLLALALATIALLLRARRFGPALFLALTTAACLGSARVQGIFVPIVCLVAGRAWAACAPGFNRFRSRPWFRAVNATSAVALVAGVAWCCAGIVTGRTALRDRQLTLFGAGASWWLPQVAAAFVEQHGLPHQLFAPFNLSSYLTWRLGPGYRDFADGRYLPFGDALIAEQLRLTAQPLDSAVWTRVAARYGIQTVLFPLARFYAIEAVPLRSDCASRDWTPVYLDSSAIVFVRNDAMPADALAALRIDCQRQPLVVNSSKPRMERYQLLANAAVIDYALGRTRDAEQSIAKARQISRVDDSLAVLEGQIEESKGQNPAATASFHRALALHESNAAWYQLGLLEASQRQYSQAVDSFRQALRIESKPDLQTQLALARAQILADATASALVTLAQAADTVTATGAEGAAERAAIDDTRAVAESRLGNWVAAVAAERDATAQTPSAAGRWAVLAALYQAAGQPAEALRAQQTAQKLAQPTPQPQP